MERIGIIDLGSNSIRLVIIQISENGAHYQKENLKETVRLVDSTDKDGMLSQEAMDYAVETVKLFVSFCQAQRVEKVIAVATAATRRASNQKAFIRRLKNETGLNFQVLSGEQEAHLGYIGTVNTIGQSSGLMVDLGGGSIKLVSIANRLKGMSNNLPFGAVTLTNQFQTKDLPTAENLANLENYLMDQFKEMPWLEGEGPIIGVGGSFRSLARVVRKEKEYVPDITDGFEMTLEDVEYQFDRLAKMTLAERLQVPGLEHSRADIMIAGVATIKCLLKASNRSKIVVSTTSIRDGLLYQYLNRYTNDPIVLSVITHHIDNLINYYNLEETHLRKVSNLAVTIFDQLHRVHGLNAHARRLLLIASLLHEIGVVVGVESRNKHTLYMLLNAPLYGLNHRERVIVAYIAASHDGMHLVNLDEYIEKGPLLPEDAELIEKLAVILQIAHSLDRCQTGSVSQVRVGIEDNICNLRIIARTSADLEIKDALRKADDFEKVFKHQLLMSQSPITV
ncbi:MAG: Ppx/GppA family phosphatase [Firmicutes bacterium]|nr:Ppx/GppA family phosphatase [Bacillota bacterium]